VQADKEPQYVERRIFSRDQDAVEREIERRANDYLSRELKDVSDAMERALRNVAQDKELVSAFWKRGYDELASHAGNNASQWVGKRLLTSVILALTTAALVWLVRSGNLK
jgi:hypothetical protein